MIQSVRTKYDIRLQQLQNTRESHSDVSSAWATASTGGIVEAATATASSAALAQLLSADIRRPFWTFMAESLLSGRVSIPVSAGQPIVPTPRPKELASLQPAPSSRQNPLSNDGCLSVCVCIGRSERSSYIAEPFPGRIGDTW